MLSRLLLAAAIAVVPLRAATHPHVFIDANASFVFDDEGRLSALRVRWTFDAFVSLFMIEALELDADQDGELSDEDRARIVADQTTWPPDYDGDSYLWVSGERAALTGPENASADQADGRVSVTFDRRLVEPVAVSDALAKLYDPVFFYAYFVAQDAALVNAPEGCEAEVELFEPDSELMLLQQSLMQLGIDETPEQEDVGAVFADRILLTCA